jgi:hypothetical protein
MTTVSYFSVVETEMSNVVGVLTVPVVVGSECHEGVGDCMYGKGGLILERDLGPEEEEWRW